jgi:hypothetical protein
VTVEVGTGEGVEVTGAVEEAVGEGKVGTEVTGFDGEQAENPTRNRSSAPIFFIA